MKLEDVIRELEVSLQALKEENAMLRDERRVDNEEAARLYDFARNKGQALEAMYMNKIQDMQHQFALDEVGGVRSDMDKEDRRLLGEINELKRKVEDLQK